VRLATRRLVISAIVWLLVLASCQPLCGSGGGSSSASPSAGSERSAGTGTTSSSTTGTANRPPVAVLEVAGSAGGYGKTAAVHIQGPGASLSGTTLLPAQVSFRASRSSDPDRNIVSWHIDFGDHTSTVGCCPPPSDFAFLTAAPPPALAHTYYLLLNSDQGIFCPMSFTWVAQLTVTDAGVLSSSDQVQVTVDCTPNGS
jgi:hypothetical protein